jgi:hypothetical protein
MSKYLRPDSSSKMMRYRASLAMARKTVSVGGRRKRGNYDSTMYHTITERGRKRPLMNWDKKRPYALNIQFKIRFFGMLHHHVGHGPEVAAKRFKQAELRWEGIFPRKRKVSKQIYDRRRAYM